MATRAQIAAIVTAAARAGAREALGLGAPPVPHTEQLGGAQYPGLMPRFDVDGVTADIVLRRIRASFGAGWRHERALERGDREWERLRLGEAPTKPANSMRARLDGGVYTAKRRDSLALARSTREAADASRRKAQRLDKRLLPWN